MYKYTSNKDKNKWIICFSYQDKTLLFKSVGVSKISLKKLSFIEKEYIKLMKSDSKIHL